MANLAEDKSLQRYARLAGFMYLILIPVFMIPKFITSGMVVPGHFVATAHNIATSEFLYRIALTGQALGTVATVLLIGALYIVTKRVDSNLALLALLWRVAEVVLGGLAAVIQFTSLQNYIGAISNPDLGGRMLNHLLTSGYETSFNVSTLFFSVGSSVFFYLLLKARFIPRLLAAFGILASVIVLMFAFISLVVPERAPALELLGWAPIFIAEITTGFWMLIAGVNSVFWNQRAMAATPAAGD